MKWWIKLENSDQFLYKVKDLDKHISKSTLTWINTLKAMAGKNRYINCIAFTFGEAGIDKYTGNSWILLGVLSVVILGKYWYFTMMIIT